MALGKAFFVRVHAQIACDGDGWLMRKLPGVRMGTSVQYLIDAWEKYGGWE